MANNNNNNNKRSLSIHDVLDIPNNALEHTHDADDWLDPKPTISAFVPKSPGVLLKCNFFAVISDPENPGRFKLQQTPLTALRHTKGYEACPANQQLKHLYKNFYSLSIDERATLFNNIMVSIQATSDQIKVPYFMESKRLKQDNTQEFYLEKFQKGIRKEILELCNSFIELKVDPAKVLKLLTDPSAVDALVAAAPAYGLTPPREYRLRISEYCVVDASTPPREAAGDDWVPYATPSPKYTPSKAHEQVTVLSSKQERFITTDAMRALFAGQVLYAMHLNKLLGEDIFHYEPTIQDEIEQFVAEEYGSQYVDRVRVYEYQEYRDQQEASEGWWS